MAIKKILTSGYFWTIVAALAITIWIYNASPQNLDKFTKIIEQRPLVSTKGRKRKGRTKRLNVCEERCRKIFEDIFQTNFPTTRKIKWLKNPETNRPLELDGYNPYVETPIGTGLAFEYDGAQHAAPNTHFHNIDADAEFSKQFRRDRYKTELCEKHKVMLIRIHHWVDFDQLEPFIRKKLKENGFDISLKSKSGDTDGRRKN